MDCRGEAKNPGGSERFPPAKLIHGLQIQYLQAHHHPKSVQNRLQVPGAASWRPLLIPGARESSAPGAAGAGPDRRSAHAQGGGPPGRPERWRARKRRRAPLGAWTSFGSVSSRLQPLGENPGCSRSPLPPRCPATVSPTTSSREEGKRRSWGRRPPRPSLPRAPSASSAAIGRSEDLGSGCGDARLLSWVGGVAPRGAGLFRGTSGAWKAALVVFKL